MLRIAAIFGTELDDAMKPFHVQRHDNRALGTTIHEAAQHQKTKAEIMQQQQDTDSTESPCAQKEAHAEVHILTKEVA